MSLENLPAHIIFKLLESGEITIAFENPDMVTYQRNAFVITVLAKTVDPVNFPTLTVNREYETILILNGQQGLILVIHQSGYLIEILWQFKGFRRLVQIVAVHNIYLAGLLHTGTAELYLIAGG